MNQCLFCRQSAQIGDALLVLYRFIKAAREITVARTYWTSWSEDHRREVLGTVGAAMTSRTRLAALAFNDLPTVEFQAVVVFCAARPLAVGQAEEPLWRTTDS